MVTWLKGAPRDLGSCVGCKCGDRGLGAWASWHPHPLEQCQWQEEFSVKALAVSPVGKGRLCLWVWTSGTPDEPLRWTSHLLASSRTVMGRERAIPPAPSPFSPPPPPPSRKARLCWLSLLPFLPVCPSPLYWACSGPLSALLGQFPGLLSPGTKPFKRASLMGVISPNPRPGCPRSPQLVALWAPALTHMCHPQPGALPLSLSPVTVPPL